MFVDVRVHYRRPASCLLAPVVICSLCYLLLGQWTFDAEPTATLNVSQSDNATASKTKTILIWNGLSRFELDVWGTGREAFVRHQCPAPSDCYITRNKSYLPIDSFDAVIIHIPTFSHFLFPADGPRSPHQRYVFFSQEPPPYIGEDVGKYDGYFNWTMDYQSTSDIPYTYGRVVPLEGAVRPEEWLDHSRGKTKMVAWFSSHCYTQSRREKYVSLMRKYIQVDIYGGCHMMNCSLNETSYLSSPQCYDMLESDYMFYLSFENAICGDYVTEKFFDLLDRRIVPVVLGGANYSAVAPPHSYIDASLYSPKELAAYLLLLAADRRLYNAYFEWKRHYRVEGRYPLMASRALCHLCRKLHANEGRKTYDHMSAHFGRQQRCRQPKFKDVRLLWGFI